MSFSQVIALLIFIQQVMLLNATQHSNNLKSENTTYGFIQKRSTCTDNKCADYCLGTCGPNTRCAIENYVPYCVCLPGFVGDPRTGCVQDQCHSIEDCPEDKICSNSNCTNPCLTACGPHTTCDVHNHVPYCACIAGHVGNPRTGCTAVECLTNEDCPEDRICSKSNCTNPCLTACGPHTTCDVHNHVPYCVCTAGHVGNPRRDCTAVECIQHQQCPESKACVDGACRDPCPGVCGNSTTCRVFHHAPTCLCKEGYTGDPYQGCAKAQKVYHVQTGKMLNWYEALADCFSRGMRLATVQDEQEYNLLVDTLKRLPHYTYWLSGADLGKNGSYVWMSTGGSMNYTRWHWSEPDWKTSYVPEREVQHCVITGRHWLASTEFNMFTNWCSHKFYYVCEE